MAKPIGNVFKGIGAMFGVGGKGPQAPDVPPPPPITPREVIRADSQASVSKRIVEMKSKSPNVTRGKVSASQAATSRKTLLTKKDEDA